MVQDRAMTDRLEVVYGLLIGSIGGHLGMTFTGDFSTSGSIWTLPTCAFYYLCQTVRSIPAANDVNVKSKLV